MKIHNCFIIVLGKDACLHAEESDDFEGNVVLNSRHLPAKLVATLKKMLPLDAGGIEAFLGKEDENEIH